MKTGPVTKIAASALVIGALLVSCAPGASQTGIASASSGGKAEKQAATAAAKAEKAMKVRDHVRAIAEAETAVAASPRDAAYRMLLGQAYLAGGRFVSAESAFADTLTLEPGNARAVLNLALARIALGQPRMGLDTLELAGPGLSDTDRGLAVALAGDLEGAIALLEPAARATDASPKTRQNLALVYALAGKWNEARAIASQDVSPDRLDRTLASWAGFAQPQKSWDQVASLLGVRPIYDRGQPARLALAPMAAAPVQVAAAPEPVMGVIEEPVAAPEPVQIAQAIAAPELVQVAEPAPLAAPAPVSPALAAVTFAPRQPVVQSIPASASAVTLTSRKRTIAFAAPAKSRDGRYVVQIGAHDSAQMAEWAWKRAVSRHKVLASYAPTGETFGAFHRVAAGGFATRTDAAKVCGQVRASGGSCFVREATRQAPAQWAVRFGTRVASR